MTAVALLSYEALSASGHCVRGSEEVESADALRARLMDRDLLLVECRSQPPGGASLRTGGRLGGTRSDLTTTMLSLATMLEVGSPLDHALDIAGRSARHAKTRSAFWRVRDRVREGSTLADAMADVGDPYSGIAVGFVRAGERAGRLTSTLRELVRWMQRSDELRASLIGSLTYPVIVSGVGFMSVAMLLVFVLPVFSELLSDAQVPLPTTTRLLLTTGRLSSDWWPGLVLALSSTVLLARRYLRSTRGRRRFHAVCLRLPVVGPLREAFAAVQVGRTLANLLEQGTPVLRTLGICEQVVTDEVVRLRLAGAIDQVRAGGRLAPALASCGCFPLPFLHLVEVGEESGRLPDLLGHASALAERDLQQRLQVLARLAEPAMIVLLGGVVGFVALALLQAVYGLQAVGL